MPVMKSHTVLAAVQSPPQTVSQAASYQAFVEAGGLAFGSAADVTVDCPAPTPGWLVCTGGFAAVPDGFAGGVLENQFTGLNEKGIKPP